MFCPKCGIQNPDTGKFCRSCGTDLGNVSAALSGKPVRSLKSDPEKAASCDSAITRIFMGIAFLAVSIILGFTGMGRNWWFWMLIPAFGMIGSGVASYVQWKRLEGSKVGFAADDQSAIAHGTQPSSLPPSQTVYVPPESRFKTGDLIPPSVTDTTTRKLEMDSEGETMTLPKV